jgi:hypothetical protein
VFVVARLIGNARGYNVGGMLHAVVPAPAMSSFELWSLVATWLDAMITITVVVVAVLALRRIAAAAESTARSAAATQHVLQQIQASTANVARTIAS